MENKRLTKTSKFISLILRHKPETINIKLDDNGCANVEDLLEKMSKKGHHLQFDDLVYIVKNNNKKRFIFNEDQTKIRANQGHSIPVELNLESIEPPPILYHGTATRFIESIQEKGLIKGNRQHVHLSADLDTASQVGKRHGKLVILQVKATEMHQQGHSFFSQWSVVL